MIRVSAFENRMFEVFVKKNVELSSSMSLAYGNPSTAEAETEGQPELYREF